MTYTTSELMWIQYLICEMSVIYDRPMMMYCDNQVITYIANNPVFMSERSILKLIVTLSET